MDKNVTILLDSGAAVTVVPDTLVADEQLTKETTLVRGFQGKPGNLPLANVCIKVGDLELNELHQLLSVVTRDFSYL